MINLVVAKLYYNFKYGINTPRPVQFVLAKIAFCFIVCFWIVALIKVVETYLFDAYRFPTFDSHYGWLYTALFIIGFFFINRITWSLSEAEKFISDEENQKPLRNGIIIFWLLIVFPIVIILYLPSA